MTLQKILSLYNDRRLLVIFGFGIISGFPWVLIGSAMTAWLQEAGLTRTAIGFFGSVFAVYAFNFLWAPALDKLRLPILWRLGRRKSWLLLMQAIILILVIAISFTDPTSNLILTSTFALGIALASATQDTAIDAYRIEVLDESESEKVPAGAAMATSGWWAGYSLPGAAALILSDFPSVDWSDIYLVLAAFTMICMIFVFFVHESTTTEIQDEEKSNYSAPTRMNEIVLEPLAEFFRRNGVKLAIYILLFLFLFKLGEAFLGRMSIVFYKEVGFTNTQIGVYSKLVGWWGIIIFSLLASVINIKFGIVRGLLISGIAMASTNLLFSVIAWVGPVQWLFALTVIVDQFTAAFATVAFVSFISHLTNRVYTATQYALMASISNFGRTTLAVFSGVIVDQLGGDWGLFFIITALMVIPPLLLLTLIAKHVETH